MTTPTTVHTLGAPLDGATAGLLELPNGAAHLEVSGDLGVDGLYRAEVRSPAPAAEAHEGRVSLRYRRFSRITKGSPDRVELNTEIPWEIVSGPLSHTALDLTATRLNSVTTGEASRLSLDLPEIQGTVPVIIGGSASSLTVHRPASTAIRVRIKGGSTRVELDSDVFGSIGGPTTWNSPGHEEAEGVYELSIEGNVSTLRVTTR
jgi:hypothetical protein